MSNVKRPTHVAAACLPGSGIPGACDRCAAELPPRRGRWCSDECRDAYYADHIFAMSRWRARQRDGGCTAPGCDVKDGVGPGVEVDHIDAAEGRHGVHACVHHLDNLRCLCHAHHADRTREQRRVSAKEHRQVAGQLVMAPAAPAPSTTEE